MSAHPRCRRSARETQCEAGSSILIREIVCSHRERARVGAGPLAAPSYTRGARPDFAMLCRSSETELASAECVKCISWLSDPFKSVSVCCRLPRLFLAPCPPSHSLSLLLCGQHPGQAFLFLTPMGLMPHNVLCFWPRLMLYSGSPSPHSPSADSSLDESNVSLFAFLTDNTESHQGTGKRKEKCRPGAQIGVTQSRPDRPDT